MINGISQTHYVEPQAGSTATSEAERERRRLEELESAKLQPVAEAAQTQTAQNARHKYDEYVPSNGATDEAPGLYRLETDEAGNQKVIFTPPEEVEAKGPDAAAEPDKAADSPEDEKPDTYTATATLDPGAVKAEIARIRQQRGALQQQLSRAGNDEERRSAEARLAQIDAELAMKDNPEYIKRNATMSVGPATREA